MSKYYTNNAVYDRLASTSNHNFLWISGDAWFLIYGDSMGNPRLLAFNAFTLRFLWLIFIKS